jgi:hypothetical protein
MHHDACTRVRVLGHQNNVRDNIGDNMRDNKGDNKRENEVVNPAGPADCCSRSFLKMLLPQLVHVF